MKKCKTSSHSVLASPFSGSCLVLWSVSLVDVSDFGHERVVRVGVSQQRADRQEHLGDSEGRRPLILQDVQANATVRIDVRVVNSRSEVALGWLERVVSGEVNGQKENPSLKKKTKNIKLFFTLNI